DQPTDETQEYLDWAQQMLNEIKRQWDWDKKIDALPPGILYSIESDIKEIKRQWDWDKKIDALPPGILYSIESDIKEILKRVKESKDNE
ncbi:unnamed protein product, partial [marine sediment metagenome]